MTTRSRTLEELGTVARGRSRHRPRDADFLYGGPYPFVQTGDVKRAVLFLKEFSQTYSEAGLAQSRLWSKGTLCITIAANIAETAILGMDACFPDSVIGFIANEDECDVRFVKYWFDVFKLRFQQVSKGAAQDNLSQTKLLSFKLDVPPLDVQRRIADSLSLFDRLIENNARRISLLDSILVEAYREWFFSLRFPGHEKTRVVDGTPRGWRKCTLGDLTTLQYGKALKEADRRPGDFPVFGSSGIVGAHDMYLVDGPGIIIGRKGNVGSVHWSQSAFWPIDTVYFVEPEKVDLFLFYALKAMRFISTDVAVPGLNRSYAHRKKLLAPSDELRSKFVAVAEPVTRQIHLLTRQNAALATTRELLLPKLINGNITM